MSRRLLAPCLAAALSLLNVAAAEPTVQQALVLARAYLARWQNTLVSLVADEQYDQELRPYRYTSAGILQPLGSTKRRLLSEVVFVRAPAENAWLSFRDVIEVDGKPVTDRTNRLETLFSGGAADVMATATVLAAEGARYNLGQLGRTINTPTAALVFLQPLYEQNTTWRLDTNARLGQRRLWSLRFDQRKPPFAVTMTRPAHHASSGRFWIEPGTGRIHQWELVVDAGSASFRVTMTYGAVSSVREAWVPLQMQDQYHANAIERVTGVATYTNHRLFRTGIRIVGPSPR